MSMQLYNFLSRKVEEFKPIGKTVGLYTCGPTVYDFVHIGNWRTFVFEDILKRVLTFNGFNIRHVMNITDIDDKIIKGARSQSLEIREFTQKFEKAFFDDLDELNIIKADKYPKATDHITSIIRIIEVLIRKGLAYEKKGSVYFAISKFKDYGKLSGANTKGIKAGARVDVDEYDKDSPQDFALWKVESEEAKRHSEAFDSPWGVGRPGWHVECSAMSMHYLGEKFDIHTGGVDLLFPHHENEIAQSEGATGKKFVNFWLEGEHLLVEGEKMAKRLGNIFMLEDIIKKGFDPLALRYLFLTAHYRSKLNFTWRSLEAARNALDNLRDEISSWEEPKISCAEFEVDFQEAVNNDLDMPKALAIMQELVRSGYPSHAKHRSLLIMDEVLGLGIANIKRSELPKSAKQLIDRREVLRSSGKFKEADIVREKLKKMGVKVEDTLEGPKFKVKSQSKK